jgi:2,4-dienoyl-CoA reductase-like NADH-dependent reductase (Old Yellow Enzyme family)
LYDGVPYPNGFGTVEDQNEIFPAKIDLKEPMKIVDELYDLGIRLINLTAGNPHYKPQITRPFDIPVEGGNIPDEHPLFGVHRMVDMVGEVRKKMANDLIIIGSGYSYLRQFAGYVAAGAIQENLVDVCGFGRMAFANPNFPKQLFFEGKIDKKKTCITCSKCSGFMKKGISTGCAIRDPFYRDRSL